MQCIPTSSGTEALFRKAINSSTLSETYLNYAELLASQGRTAEARLRLAALPTRDFPQVVKTVPVMRRLMDDASVLEQARELPGYGEQGNPRHDAKVP
jgi:hypothetical protein